MSAAGGLEEVVLSASSIEGAVQVWCAAAARHTCAHAPRRRLTRSRRALGRDLDTCTLLASYKGNASPRGCLCRMGATHFLAGAFGGQPPCCAVLRCITHLRSPGVPN
jgi:hypothetical protein